MLEILYVEVQKDKRLYDYYCRRMQRTYKKIIVNCSLLHTLEHSTQDRVLTSSIDIDPTKR